MAAVADMLIVLIVLQTALRLSQWPRLWPRFMFCTAVGIAVLLSTGYATGLSKLQVEGWLHDTAILQNIAIACLLDALLIRYRWYPGLLILPAAFYVLCLLLFNITGADFNTIGLLLGVTVALLLPLLAQGLRWLLPQCSDRSLLLLTVTIILCLTCLINAQSTAQPLVTCKASMPSAHLATDGMAAANYSLFTLHLPLIMDYISKALFGIANILLIPDILLLIIFFIRSLILLFTTYLQYTARRSDEGSSLYQKYRGLLHEHEPEEAYTDYLVAQMEAEAAKDVNLSRLLTKLGPVLGLIGTLISMSPALVGLSNGDISGMAYNMQVVFSATVVGLVISIVGLFTQQLKSRWHQQDISRLEYDAAQYMKEVKQEQL